MRSVKACPDLLLMQYGSMSETLGPGPEDIGFSESESRFGDKEALCNIMEHGKAEIAGRLEDFQDVAPHRNVVELAYVRHEMIGTRGLNDFVVIDDESGNRVEAIFKPVSGEDKKFYNQNGLGHDYPREVAAYLVSEYFGLDLVPPTIYRSINDKLGSLQLYMPHDRYRTGFEAKSAMDNTAVDNFVQSKEVQKLQVLDWIIANADRNVNNYMLKTGPDGAPDFSQGEPEIIAIDNGIGFNELFYRLMANRNDISGPHQFLTKNHITKETVTTRLPDQMLENLKNGYEHRDILSERLLSLPDIPKVEIDSMWDRVKGLIDSGVFLSGYNYREHTNLP